MEDRKETPAPAASPRKLIAAERTQSGGPKPNENTTTNDERRQKALHMDYEARLWINEHHDRWMFMTSLAIQEVRGKRKFGMKWLIEQCRRKDFAGKMASNTLAPAFSRILIDEHPECRRYMVTRHSMIDEVQ